MMRREHPHIGLKTLCGLFGNTRQAYYKQRNVRRTRAFEEELVLELVTQIRQEMPQLGTRKLLHLLQPPLSNMDISIGRDRLFDLLATEGLLLSRRKRKPRTTFSGHGLRVFPDLQQNLVLTGPCQLWVADITYLEVGDGFCYLSLVTDAYSRRVMGYCLARSLDAQGCIDALKMAFLLFVRGGRMPVHHTDRGTQYCSYEYLRLLEQHGFLVSMTETGDPRDNPVAERMNGVLKHELGLNRKFLHHTEAVAAVELAVRLYNQRRPHGSVDYLTPDEAHQRSGLLPQRWTNYRKQRALARHGGVLDNDETSLNTPPPHPPQPADRPATRDDNPFQDDAFWIATEIRTAENRDNHIPDLHHDRQLEPGLPPELPTQSRTHV